MTLNKYVPRTLLVLLLAACSTKEGWTAGDSERRSQLQAIEDEMLSRAVAESLREADNHSTGAPSTPYTPDVDDDETRLRLGIEASRQTYKNSAKASAAPAPYAPVVDDDEMRLRLGIEASRQTYRNSARASATPYVATALDDDDAAMHKQAMSYKRSAPASTSDGDDDEEAMLRQALELSKNPLSIDTQREMNRREREANEIAYQAAMIEDRRREAERNAAKATPAPIPAPAAVVVPMPAPLAAPTVAAVPQPSAEEKRRLAADAAFARFEREKAEKAAAKEAAKEAGE